MTPQNEYLEMTVLTAPPHRLHLIVVEAAVRHARIASAALELKEFETMSDSLGRSREMVAELLAGLTDEHQPELIRDLRGLFVFVYRQLMEAEFTRDMSQIDAAISVLDKHQKTWNELINSLGDVALETEDQPRSLNLVT